MLIVLIIVLPLNIYLFKISKSTRKKVWIMFKVKNNDTRMTSLMLLFWNIFYTFTPLLSRVFTFNCDQVFSYSRNWRSYVNWNILKFQSFFTKQNIRLVDLPTSKNQSGKNNEKKCLETGRNKGKRGDFTGNWICQSPQEKNSAHPKTFYMKLPENLFFILVDETSL